MRVMRAEIVASGVVVLWFGGSGWCCTQRVDVESA